MSDTAIEALRYSEFPNSSDCISRQTMTEAEIITRLVEGHGRCDTCEYEHYPKSVRPCEDCIYQEDRRSDNWKPKETEHEQG